jgi:hypothetical protein
MAYEHWSECMDNEIHKAHIENEIENLPQLYEMIDD